MGREADIRSECHTEVSSGGVKGLVDIATGHSLRYDLITIHNMLYSKPC